MARPNYSGEKRRKELEKQKKKEEKKRRKLEHASLPARSEEVIEASDTAPGQRTEEGGQKTRYGCGATAGLSEDRRTRSGRKGLAHVPREGETEVG